MSKTYLMPGEELTPEQRESVKNFTKEQEQKNKEVLDKQVELNKRRRASLEELLKTRIDPTEDRVLVWPDPVEELTEGGILKPQEVIDRERPLFGTVIAVGPGKKDDTTLTNKLLLEIYYELKDPQRTPEWDTFDKLKKQVNQKQIPYAPGDRIMYGRMAGTPVEDPDTKEPLLVMRPFDIFSKIRS